MRNDNIVRVIGTIQHTLLQISNSLHALNEEEYRKNLPCLSNASVGQHIRHIVEFFECLNRGYETGIVNYDNRQRNQAVENDKTFAIHLIAQIAKKLCCENKDLVLQTNDLSDQMLQVPSNYFRELIYNFEHMIHHMAMIRVAIEEISDISLPEEYGVAPSTLKHRRHVCR